MLRSFARPRSGSLSASTRTRLRRFATEPVDLVRFGYAQLAIQRNSRGMHLGLVVTITDKVRPFYEEAKRLAAWLAEQHKAAFRPFAGVLSSANKGDRLVAQKPNQRIFLYRFLRKCGHRPLYGSWKAYEKDGASFVPPS